MTLLLTDEQRSIQALARDFAHREIVPVSAQLESGCLDTLQHLWGKMADAGFPGLAFPESLGGAGVDSLSYYLVLSELAQVSAGLATSLSVHVSLVSLPLVENATPEQTALYADDLISARKIGAFALTEPDAGSDAGNGTCKALPVDGGFLLNGSKIFISNALIGHVFLVTARTDPNTPGPKGLTAFIIDRETPGLTIQPGDEKMGLKGGDWGELHFQDCFVGHHQQLGALGNGFKLFMNNLNVGRISIAAISTGIAQACLQASLDYAKQREQFGKPIGEFQAIQFKLADMATQIEASLGLIHHAATLKDAGLPFAKEAAMAKLFASEAVKTIASEAIQIHGGYGYTTDFPVERYFRDARVMSLFEGTSEIQHLVIARHLLGNAMAATSPSATSSMEIKAAEKEAVKTALQSTTAQTTPTNCP